MREAAGRAPAIALLCLGVAALYWKLILPGSGYVWFDHYDMCQMEVPRLQFLARNLHNGVFPLWNPHHWAGAPVIGEGQPGAVYPLNWLFLLMPLREGALRIAVLNWWFVAVHFLAAVFLYWFCRAQGIGRTGAVIGALAFACGGYFGSLPWLDIANGAAWTPLVMLFAVRLWTGFESRRSAALLGASLGASWLSGHHEIPLLLSYTVAIGSAAAFFRRRLDYRMAGYAGLALLAAGAVSAVQTIPMYEFGREAKRWVGAGDPLGWNERVPLTVHEDYSLSWTSLLGLVAPAATPEHHTTPFLGVAICGLALCGLPSARRNRGVAIAAAAGAVAAVYTLGVHTPLHTLAYHALPMMDKARTPARGLALVSFGVCVLAAYGADLILSGRISRRIAAMAAALALAMAGAGSLLLPPIESASRAGFLGAGIAAGLGLVAASMWRGWPAAALLLVMVGIETRAVTGARITPLEGAVCAGDLFAHAPLVRSLRARDGLGRISVDTAGIMTSLGDLYGFDQLLTFVAGAPANVLRHDLHAQRTLDLFGVTHHVDGEGRVAERATALPRAWIVHDVRRVAEAELRGATQSPDIDLARTALLIEAVPPLEQCEGDEPVEMRRPDANTVGLRATASCRGLVVVNEAMYPGWRAYVDGSPAPLHEAYGAFRAVVIEKGTHIVTMRYEPASVRLGAGLSLFGLLFCGLLARGG